MKKIEYPNRGHLLSDYLVDGISRVYEHEGNVVMILESTTGIETPNAILKNECVRLVIPKNQFHQFSNSITTIENQLGFKEVATNEKTLTMSKDKSFLGSAFNVPD